MQQVTMLQHPNIAKKHMAVIYRRCFTKDEHSAMASSQHNKLKQACKSAKDNRFTDLVKLLDMAETASGSNVQSTQSTCYRNLT